MTPEEKIAAYERISDALSSLEYAAGVLQVPEKSQFRESIEGLKQLAHTINAMHQ